ncbi:hypothetical protein GGH93_000380 [Coemansia aciculifera]|nr:hypothetical protein GGH93_000380 [Coemansia aciculifera]
MVLSSIVGDAQKLLKAYDTRCHNVGTWENPRPQVKITGTPVNFYHGSSCDDSFKTVYDRGGMIEQHTPPSWSPNVTSQYTEAMRVATQFPTTLAELAPALQQHQQPLPPFQQQQQQQMQVQRSGGMLPNSASQSAFQNYGLHVPFLSSSATNQQQQQQSLYVDAASCSQSPLSTTALIASASSGDMGENSDTPSLLEWCKTPSSSVTTLGGGADAATSSRRRCTLPQSSATEDIPFFGMVRQLQQVVSMDGSNRFAVRVFPQVDRGFFLADSEWTCYRRNYFQVSCTFGLVGERGPAPDPECPCVVMDAGGTARTAVRFLVAISAQVASTRDKDVELVQHTPKRDKGPQTTPQAQPIRCSGGPSAISSSTVCFERLQFKTATANNGKRRAAQQYYTLVVDLLADCDDGERCLIASTTSSPIVVRGRSPGHYADSGQTPTYRSDAGTSGLPSASNLGSSHSTSALGRYTMPPPPPHADASSASAAALSAIRSQNDLLSSASSPSAFATNPAAAMAAAVAAAASYGFGTDDVVSHVFPGMHPPPPHTAAAAAQGFAMGSFELQSMLPPHSAPIHSQSQQQLFLMNSAAAAAAAATGVHSSSVSVTPATSPPPLFAQHHHQLGPSMPSMPSMPSLSPSSKMQQLSTHTSAPSAYNPPYFPQAVMDLKHQPVWDTHSVGSMGPRSATPATPTSGYDSAIDSAAATGTSV